MKKTTAAEKIIFSFGPICFSCIFCAMVQFGDDWVVDRSMFDYLNGGSCSCCGLSHASMNMMEFMQACSDLETDDGKKEVRSPWPVVMRDEIWSGRVKIRKMMKDEMETYRSRLEEHREGLTSFLNDMPAQALLRLFQMPRDELSTIVQDRYDIRGGAFEVLMCAVVEQVANFHMTGYKDDGRGEEELLFEDALTFNKRCGFTLNFEEVLDVQGVFLRFLERLGGPKLMPRRYKGTRDASIDAAKEEKEGVGGKEGEEDEEEEGEGKEQEVKGQHGQSFRADRRLIRLLIARYWADRLFQMYKNS